MDAGTEGDGYGALRALILELWDRPRSPTPPEATRIRAYFAHIALRRQPNFDEVDERIALASQGRLEPGTYVDRRVTKHLLHARFQREWPTSTTVDGYMDSLERAIRNASGAMYVEWFDEHHTAHRVVSMTRGPVLSRGLRGGPYIVVTFLMKVDEARWLTGYQPAAGVRNVERQRALLGGVWLRPPG